MLPVEEKQRLFNEAQAICEYNYNHFYTTFKQQIVNELVDNFVTLLNVRNHGCQPGSHSRYHRRYEFAPEYIAEVKKRLAQ